MFYSFKALQREATERRQQETFPMASVLWSCSIDR